MSFCNLLQKWWSFKRGIKASAAAKAERAELRRRYADAFALVEGGGHSAPTYQEDPSLTSFILNLYETYKIVAVDNGEYYMQIRFSDGTLLRFWSTNRWYACATKVTINGKGWQGCFAPWLMAVLLLDVTRNNYPGIDGNE